MKYKCLSYFYFHCIQFRARLVRGLGLGWRKMRCAYFDFSLGGSGGSGSGFGNWETGDIWGQG